MDMIYNNRFILGNKFYLCALYHIGWINSLKTKTIIFKNNYYKTLYSTLIGYSYVFLGFYLNHMYKMLFNLNLELPTTAFGIGYFLYKCQKNETKNNKIKWYNIQQ